MRRIKRSHVGLLCLLATTAATGLLNATEGSTEVVVDTEVVSDPPEWGAKVFVRKPGARAPEPRLTPSAEGEGALLGNLVRYYVGRSRSEELDVSSLDLDRALRLVWDRKLAISGVTPAARKAADVVVARYAASDQRRSTLPEFVATAHAEAQSSWSRLDFVGLCREFRLSSERCVTLRHATGRLGGEEIVAYGMTEMMPTKDGRVNAKMLGVTLELAGEDFLNAVPALGDPLLSFGFYQFTSHALRHDATGRHGASRVAAFAGRGLGLPGSVLTLDSLSQHRAAFYFATYNLAELLRRMSPAEYRGLKRGGPFSEEELVQFVSASHHLPAVAQRAARKWAAAGRTKPLGGYLRGRLGEYARKSVSNLRGLRGRLDKVERA
jgi:hypothetical protein